MYMYKHLFSMNNYLSLMKDVWDFYLQLYIIVENFEDINIVDKRESINGILVLRITYCGF